MQRDLFSGRCLTCKKIAAAMRGFDRETIARTAARAHAAECLDGGQPPSSVESLLVANGLAAPTASAVLSDLMADRATYQVANEMLNGGAPLGEVRRKLAEMGLDRDQALGLIEAVQQRRTGKLADSPPVAVLLGLFLLVGGFLLFIGNKSGLFVTFSFAGVIIMGAGSVVLAASRIGGKRQR